MSYPAQTELDRRIGPVLLTLYGVGVMVGAGIYVLVGLISAQTGLWTPLVFIASGLIATPTALAYAELSVRIPKSGGEAAYMRTAFGQEWPAILVGLALATVGVSSAATVLQGGVGYLGYFTSADPRLLVTLLCLALVGVAVYGVLESMRMAALFTITEVVGLIIVIIVGMGGPASADWTAGLAAEEIYWGGFGPAILLAFFAFVGFEDMVNMAEEVRDPARSMPIAILGALVITSLLYALVSLAAVRSVDVEVLGASQQPLALVFESATGRNPGFLAAISVFAALNGVLAQIMMAARVLFGLGRGNRAFAVFHQVHPRCKTPWVATLFIGALVLLCALFFRLTRLAEVSSVIILLVFTIMNATLLVLKRRSKSPGFSVPSWVPWTGLLCSAAALSSLWLR